jgi:GH18 family chitinase
MIQRFNRSFALSLATLSLVLCCLSGVSQAQGPQGKVLAGFFEEWSIYYANYNIADMQANSVASHMSHFVYAFANVTTTPGRATHTEAFCCFPFLSL